MCIVYFIDDLGRGGTQTWLTILAEGLSRLGYEQYIYCVRNIVHPEMRQTLGQWAGVEVLGEPCLWAGIGLVKVYTGLKRRRPDIVQTLLPTSDMLGRALSRLAGMPLIVSSIRSINSYQPRRQLLLNRLTARWASRVIFNSRAAIPFAMAHEGVTPAQVVYIPNGVRRRPPPSPVEVAAARAQLNLPAGAKVVGNIARLDPKKGHRDLLAAFTRVVRQIPEAVLLIAGDGPLRDDLAGEARRLNLGPQARFLGDRSDTPVLLALFDVYAHSSVSEAMPNAVLEAMAAANPIVATRVGSLPDMITSGECGWLVEPGQPAALAGQLIYALDHPALARQMGLAAAARAHDYFSAEQMVAAYHTLYQQLTAVPGG